LQYSWAFTERERVILYSESEVKTSIRYEDTTRGRNQINCKEDMLNFTSRVTKKQMEKVAGE
jgi:hypothetical protein